MKLAGKTALVTGAARRVGRVIATTLAKKGVHIAVHYNHSRNEAGALARELSACYGVRAETFRADLLSTAQISKLVSASARKMGGLDILINNASIYESSVFGKTTQRHWDDHLNANLRAPFFLAQAAAPYLKRSGQGTIINIADWSGLRPYADYIAYCVSKAGLLCLTTALAKALAPKIRVNAVMPGPVLLPENYSKKGRQAVQKATLLKRLGSPEDVAQAVLYLIERGTYTTGAALPVDGGRLIA